MMLTCGMLVLENGFLVMNSSLPFMKFPKFRLRRMEKIKEGQNLSLVLALRYGPLFFVGYVGLKNGLSETES